MAAITTSEVASGSLICKTWVLKVSIHCEGCKREVKKALQKLEGVYTISVDSQQNEVRVTGNIGSEALLNRLSRMGKHAEIVHENSPAKPKLEKGQKQSFQKAPSVEPPSNNGKSNENGGQRKPPQVSPAAAAADTSGKNENPAKNSKQVKEKNAGPEGNNKGKGKKKGNVDAMPNAGDINKKQSKAKTEGDEEKEETKQPQGSSVHEQKEVDSGPSQETVLSYRTHDLFHHYVPLQPSVYSDADQSKSVQGKVVEEGGQEEVRESSVNSFDMFSEENANGCSIM